MCTWCVCLVCVCGVKCNIEQPRTYTRERANFCKRDQRGERGGGEGGRGKGDGKGEGGERKRKEEKKKRRRGGESILNSTFITQYVCQFMCIVLCHHPLPLLLHTARSFVTPFSSSRLCPSSTSGHRCLPCSHLLPHPHLHRLLYYHLSSSSPPPHLLSCACDFC